MSPEISIVVFARNWGNSSFIPRHISPPPKVVKIKSYLCTVNISNVCVNTLLNLPLIAMEKMAFDPSILRSFDIVDLSLNCFLAHHNLRESSRLTVLFHLLPYLAKGPHPSEAKVHYVHFFLKNPFMKIQNI